MTRQKGVNRVINVTPVGETIHPTKAIRHRVVVIRYDKRRVYHITARDELDAYTRAVATLCGNQSHTARPARPPEVNHG